MLAPTFGYAHHDLPVTARELPWNEPNPGRQMASIFELGSIADGGNDCSGRLGANTLDGGDAPAELACIIQPIDPLVAQTGVLA